ncbi:MAG: TIGR03067 domain-containing protein [Planctomycetales bacterium]
MRKQGGWGLVAVLGTCALISTLGANEKGADSKDFQGFWQVVELVEDGRVIPRESIRDFLPSGGKLEVIENAIVFTNPHDGKRHVRTFAVDPTRYPRTIDLTTGKKQDASGIYRFDEGRLVICLADPEEADRPREFAAKEGSKRTLMVLERAAAPVKGAAPETRSAPTHQETEGTTAKVLNDAEVTEMLKGTWKYNDRVGTLYLILNADGTFSTVREVQELRLFHKSFIQTPVSSGKWQVQEGELSFHVTSSTQFKRVGTTFAFTVRSISSKDLIFVDFMGRLGQAAKVRSAGPSGATAESRGSGATKK